MAVSYTHLDVYKRQLLLIVLAYVAYLLIDYHREEDNLPLEVTEPASGVQAGAVPTGETLSITSWNIGFGAYTDQYSFFMDGGEYSRGFSNEIVEKTVEQISDDLVSFDSDFYFLQEVDTDATRSYHLNEYEMIASRFDEKYKIFAQNYDSSYLFYPCLLYTSPFGQLPPACLPSPFLPETKTRKPVPFPEQASTLTTCVSFNITTPSVSALFIRVSVTVLASSEYGYILPSSSVLNAIPVSEKNFNTSSRSSHFTLDRLPRPFPDALSFLAGPCIFSNSSTLASGAVLLRVMAAARPAGPAPTITAS